MRVALLALALGACTPASPRARHPEAAVATPRDDLPGLENFARVSPVLYRGAQPTAAGFRTLRAMGVRTIVNLRSAHSDRALIAGLGFRYVEIPGYAWSPEPEVVAKVLAIVRTPENQPVFVHCQHGADRTGYTIGSYRIVEQSWDRDSAVRELRRFRFHSVWGAIPAFLAELDEEAMRLRVQRTKPPAIETL